MEAKWTFSFQTLPSHNIYVDVDVFQSCCIAEGRCAHWRVPLAYSSTAKAPVVRLVGTQSPLRGSPELGPGEEKCTEGGKRKEKEKRERRKRKRKKRGEGKGGN